MAVKGPLTGVRIVDLSQAHAGPYGTQILGDMGAEVIKVETPAGDLVRMPLFPGGGYYNLALNRNKKGIVLDLWTNSGKEAFYDLVKISDVVFDNFRVGATKRLGADYETLKQINPRIISASISGYGSSGPYAEFPSFDDIAQGISGMASLCGEPGGAPMRSAAAIADVSAGIFCTYGIVIALYEREKTGVGRRIEVNLLDCCMALLDNMFQFYFTSGNVPPPQGTKHPLMPLLGYFKCKNGYIAAGPSWPRICRVLNREWMIDDPKFKDMGSRMMNKKELEEALEEAFQEANVEDWLDLMRVEDMPVGLVNTLDKVIEDPQVIHNKAVVEMEHPEYGKMRAVDCPIKMPGAVEGEYTPPPLLGEHTEEVLKGILGYSDEKIARLKKEQEENAEEMKKHVRKMIG
ncbi:MAG: CoA transferase [Dehalococcoidia bacterium]|nr:CoA transferase [Dehalococcoidia bacterium]